MNWEQFLADGEKAVQIVRSGLKKRNLHAGESIITSFNTDEDIPIYNSSGSKHFWISVKSVSGNIQDPIRQMPSNYKGWMCAAYARSLNSRIIVNHKAIAIVTFGITWYYNLAPYYVITSLPSSDQFPQAQG